MRVLVTGANGQLGWELRRTVPAGTDVSWMTRDTLDVTDRQAVLAKVANLQPTHIVNAAAYTAVDRAEEEVEQAYAANAEAPAHLAEAAAQVGAMMVQVSTDFVFDGSASRPYPVESPTSPVCVYGASKAAGERRVLELAPEALVLRTAWVYSSHGANFVRTMLRLLGERATLKVVCDQIGTPTWAHGLAEAIWGLLERDVRGVRHWTDAGVASWYDFAVAIGEEARSLGLLSDRAEILPIPTEEFPTPAKRPAFSVLDKSDTWRALGRCAPHWRIALRSMLKELAVEQRFETGDAAAGRPS